MKKLSPVLFVLSTIFLTACSPASPGNNGAIQSDSSSSSSAETESGSMVITPTSNVSYVGTITELGASITMQGTHKLLLADGQFILLESTDANLSLDTYLGKQVEVRGSVQPTVEGNSGIMRVEEVTILEAFNDSSSSSESSTIFCGGIAGIPCPSGMSCVDNPNDSCDPNYGGADCGGMCVRTIVPASSVASSSSSKTPAEPAPQSSSASSAPDAPSASMEAAIVLMAKQKNDDALWTQKYCTGHATFCVAAHKNWYFKSFGATTSNLWHVEFGMSPIEELHTGPIVLNLVSGTSATMNAKDGEIRSEGSDIVAFKDWTGGTHFELIADARLREAVQIMLRSITSYTPAE